MKENIGIKLNGEWGRKCRHRMFWSFFAGVWVGAFAFNVLYNVIVL